MDRVTSYCLLVWYIYQVLETNHYFYFDDKGVCINKWNPITTGIWKPMIFRHSMCRMISINVAKFFGVTVVTIYFRANIFLTVFSVIMFRKIIILAIWTKNIILNRSSTEYWLKSIKLHGHINPELRKLILCLQLNTILFLWARWILDNWSLEFSLVYGSSAISFGFVRIRRQWC